MHHRSPRVPITRWIWKHHYVHHSLDATKNDGLTSPLWDHIFFTRQHVDTLAIPERHGPSWPEEGIVGANNSNCFTSLVLLAWSTH
jgi:hypothetical protein